MENRFIELRAHHLLCMPMFSGHGYSEGFCAHMYEIIEMLHTGKVGVRIMASPDEACSACPNLRQLEAEHLDEEGDEICTGLPFSKDPRIAGKVCKHEGRTSSKDQMLIDSFGLQAGKCYLPKELTKTVLEHMNTAVYGKSCGKCQWGEQGLCSYEMWRENFPKLFGQDVT